jgi:hypothetical protein
MNANNEVSWGNLQQIWESILWSCGLARALIAMLYGDCRPSNSAVFGRVCITNAEDSFPLSLPATRRCLLEECSLTGVLTQFIPQLGRSERIALRPCAPAFPSRECRDARKSLCELMYKGRGQSRSKEAKPQLRMDSVRICVEDRVPG